MKYQYNETIIEGTASTTVQAQQMTLDAVRETQIGKVGALASLMMTIFFAYIMYKDDGEDYTQTLAIITFGIVQVFILSIYKFLL